MRYLCVLYYLGTTRDSALKWDFFLQFQLYATRDLQMMIVEFKPLSEIPNLSAFNQSKLLWFAKWEKVSWFLRDSFLFNLLIVVTQ